MCVEYSPDARLGPGLISPGPQARRGESHGGEEVAGELVEARSNAPEMLELVEVALDEVALAVDAPADRAMDAALAGRRNVGLGAAPADEIEQGVGVIAAVGDDVAALEAGEQMRSGLEIVGLSGGQHQTHRQAALVDEGVDLGAQSATRAADGVILAPFFPPAACWWARMMDESIKAIECGDFAARVSKTLTHTPARAQRLKRL